MQGNSDQPKNHHCHHHYLQHHHLEHLHLYHHHYHPTPAAPTLNSRGKADSLPFLTMLTQGTFAEINKCQKTLRKEWSCPRRDQNTKDKICNNFRAWKTSDCPSHLPCSTEETWSEPQHVSPGANEPQRCALSPACKSLPFFTIPSCLFLFRCWGAWGVKPILGNYSPLFQRALITSTHR